MPRSSPSRPISQIAVGHKGFAWVEVEVHGKAAHGSRPEEGEDAILRMGRVLTRLEALDRDAAGAAAASAGSAQGRCTRRSSKAARELSSYPDRATAADGAPNAVRRTESAALDEVRAISSACASRIRRFEGSRDAMFGRPGYEVPADHELPQTLPRPSARGGGAAIRRRQLLDRRRRARPCRYSLGAVRPRRRRPSFHGGIRQRRRRAAVPRRAGGTARRFCRGQVGQHPTGSTGWRLRSPIALGRAPRDLQRRHDEPGALCLIGSRPCPIAEHVLIRYAIRRLLMSWDARSKTANIAANADRRAGSLSSQPGVS